MRFKENLLKKIEIDTIANTVLASIGPSGGDLKTDRRTMKRLLEMGGYPYQKERDLDLYHLGSESGKDKFLVLDNELAIYHTTVADVAMRKSPTIKEMVNIRNAIKILNDKDVVVSKREASLETIRGECIAALDLTFDTADIESIAGDGKLSLERGYMDGITECMSLFQELLEYRAAPKAFKVGNTRIIGELSRGKIGEPVFGPLVIYCILHNVIKWIEEPISSRDKEKMEWMNLVAMDREKAPMEGPDVFSHLARLVLKRKVAGRMPPGYS